MSSSSNSSESCLPDENELREENRNGSAKANEGMNDNMNGEKYEDDMARMIMSMMKQNATEIGTVLKKRSMVIDSICWLSQHIPRRVLNDLLEEMALLVSSVQENEYVNLKEAETPPLSSIEIRGDTNVYDPSGAHQWEASGFASIPQDTSSALPNSSNPLPSPSFQATDLEDERKDEDSLSDSSHDEKESVTVASNQLSLPRYKNSTIALLFVDISGFTKLSQVLDVENLSKTINMYFEMIVKQVLHFDGDILKFAGDAIFAEWPAQTSNPYGEEGKRSLAECIAIASMCGAKIVETCSDYPIYAPAKGDAGGAGVVTEIGSLNVHCGVGVGDVAGVHVGDHEYRREFLLVGDPIDQVAEAEGAAALGELAASHQALEVLSQICDFDDSLVLALNEARCGTIASRGHQHFRLKPSHARLLENISKYDDSNIRDLIVSKCDMYDTAALERFLQKICLYVHSVVVDEERSVVQHHRRNSLSAQERHRAEAELRNVYTMFIMPRMTAKLSGDPEKDIELFQILNKILLVVTRELSRYCGHLRQFIVDDKGVVLIANFGLRGSTFPNVISERALPCTSSIHNALQGELDVDNQIGGTIGNAYCGVVGGIRRHEFAVLGPSVNLSARLMCNSQNPGILVDNRVRLKASKDFSFNALPPVTAKGYADPVPIFEPLSAAEKRWGKAQKNFVGRKEEVSAIVRMSKELLYTIGISKMLFMQAESGTGKTAVLVQALSTIKKMGVTSKKRFVITRNVSNDGDRMVPFSMFRSVFSDILKEIQDFDSPSTLGGGPGAQDGDSSSGVTESQATTASGFTGTSSHRSLASSSFDRLAFLVKELDAPPEFMEIVGRHLLGIRGNAPSTHAKTKGANLDSIAEFMALAFVRCTCHLDLVVLALDDVHLLDGASWTVLEKIFSRAQNAFIICASRPLKSYKLDVSAEFWRNLHEVQARELRFTEMILKGLKESDIRAMVALKLSVKSEDVCPEFFKDLHARSGGMPHFAAQMLESIHRNTLYEKLDDGKIGWRMNMETGEMPDFNYSTVEELIVHRIDSLNANARQTLNLCAVLGAQFELSELVTIYQKWLHTGEDLNQLLSTIKEALDLAVTEGIIEEVYEGGQRENKHASPHVDSLEELNEEEEEELEEPDNDGDLNIQYRFHHDTWRSNILQLMLDARKRDIHRIIAESLETIALNDDDIKGNFFFIIRLFNHWRASGDKIKATDLALNIGKSFVDICINTEALKMFDEALTMWRMSTNSEEDHLIGGFSSKVINAIPAEEVTCLVKLLCAKGKCNSTLMRTKDAAQAYNEALEVLGKAPRAAEMKDRSVTFSIFSGLFVLIKQGQIELDEECTYEQELVKKFVAETKLHGDPVHYSRALGMQAEVLARIGQTEEALKSFSLMTTVYNASEHHDLVCQSYGSDRCAQVYSLAILWNLQLERNERAYELWETCLNDLMPKMNLRNVHNSMVFLWSVFMFGKDIGQHKRMGDLLQESIIRPFYEFYGEGGFTYCLPLYKPLSVLFEVCGGEGTIDNVEEKADWAISENLITMSRNHDLGMGNYGTVANTVGAEICLCLAKEVEDSAKKERLLAKGVFLARLSQLRCEGKEDNPEMPYAQKRNEPILHELEDMVRSFNVPEDMIAEYDKDKLLRLA